TISDWFYLNSLMFRKRFLSLSALCFVVLSAHWSFATSVERLNLEDLVKKARSIIVGKVTASRTYWSADHKFILTDYTVSVDESVKGQSPRSMAITTVGGKIGDLKLYVACMPSFVKGEDAVI